MASPRSFSRERHILRFDPSRGGIGFADQANGAGARGAVGHRFPCELGAAAAIVDIVERRIVGVLCSSSARAR